MFSLSSSIPTAIAQITSLLRQYSSSSFAVLPQNLLNKDWFALCPYIIWHHFIVLEVVSKRAIMSFISYLNHITYTVSKVIKYNQRGKCTKKRYVHKTSHKILRDLRCIFFLRRLFYISAWLLMSAAFSRTTFFCLSENFSQS